LRSEPRGSRWPAAGATDGTAEGALDWVGEDPAASRAAAAKVVDAARKDGSVCAAPAENAESEADEITKLVLRRIRQQSLAPSCLKFTTNLSGRQLAEGDF